MAKGDTNPPMIRKDDGSMGYMTIEQQVDYLEEMENNRLDEYADESETEEETNNKYKKSRRMPLANKLKPTIAAIAACSTAIQAAVSKKPDSNALTVQFI